MGMLASFILVGNVALTDEKWTVRETEKIDNVPGTEFISSIGEQTWKIRGFVKPDPWQN